MRTFVSTAVPAKTIKALARTESFIEALFTCCGPARIVPLFFIASVNSVAEPGSKITPCDEMFSQSDQSFDNFRERLRRRIELEKKAAMELEESERKPFGGYLQSSPKLLREFNIFPSNIDSAISVLEPFWEHTWYNIWRQVTSEKSLKAYGDQNLLKVETGIHLLLKPHASPEVIRMAKEELAGWNGWHVETIHYMNQLVQNSRHPEFQAVIDEVKNLTPVNHADFSKKYRDSIVAPHSALPAFSSKKQISFFCLGGLEQSQWALADAWGHQALTGIAEPVSSIKLASGPAVFGQVEVLLNNDLIYSLEGPSFVDIAKKRKMNHQKSAIMLPLGRDTFTPTFQNSYFKGIEMLLLESMINHTLK